MSENENEVNGGPGCRAQYGARLEALRTQLSGLDARDLSIANGRLAVFVAGAVAAAGVWFEQPWAVGLLTAAVLAFLALIIWHGRVLEQLREVRVCVAYYEHGLARLDGTWHGLGVDGEQYLPDEHLYARDLDIFGSGSLYQLLCLAESSVGRETLAEWLSGAASVAEIRRRQKACEELRPMVQLREVLAMAGAQLERRVGTQGLFAWASRPV